MVRHFLPSLVSCAKLAQSGASAIMDYFAWDVCVGQTHTHFTINFLSARHKYLQGCCSTQCKLHLNPVHLNTMMWKYVVAQYPLIKFITGRTGTGTGMSTSTNLVFKQFLDWWGLQSSKLEFTVRTTQFYFFCMCFVVPTKQHMCCFNIYHMAVRLFLLFWLVGCLHSCANCQYVQRDAGSEPGHQYDWLFQQLAQVLFISWYDSRVFLLDESFPPNRWIHGV